MRDWLAIAFQKTVVYRSLKMAAVVGTLLVLINHGDSIASGVLTGMQIVKIAVTFLVPYCVSTISSVTAIRAIMLAPGADAKRSTKT
jgi:hypothetical protein